MDVLFGIARQNSTPNPTVGSEGTGPETSPFIGMPCREWTIVFLLVVSVLINYIDRSDLSIAAPVLQRQFALSPVQLGSLLAAFFWTYALLQIIGIAGWLSDRFSAGWVLLVGYIFWSLATVATGLTTGFVTLFVMRLLLGAGESVAYPCYSRIFALLPQHYRGRANALIDAGTIAIQISFWADDRLSGHNAIQWFGVVLERMQKTAGNCAKSSILTRTKEVVRCFTSNRYCVLLP